MAIQKIKNIMTYNKSGNSWAHKIAVSWFYGILLGILFFFLLPELTNIMLSNKTEYTTLMNSFTANLIYIVPGFIMTFAFVYVYVVNQSTHRPVKARIYSQRVPYNR